MIFSTSDILIKHFYILLNDYRNMVDPDYKIISKSTWSEIIYSIENHLIENIYFIDENDGLVYRYEGLLNENYESIFCNGKFVDDDMIRNSILAIDTKSKYKYTEYIRNRLVGSISSYGDCESVNNILNFVHSIINNKYRYMENRIVVLNIAIFDLVSFFDNVVINSFFTLNGEASVNIDSNLYSFIRSFHVNTLSTALCEHVTFNSYMCIDEYNTDTRLPYKYINLYCSCEYMTDEFTRDGTDLFKYEISVPSIALVGTNKID